MTSVIDESTEPTRADLLAQLATLHGENANRGVIEQAKGALMVTYGLTADEAFDLLRLHSQSGNVKLRALAAKLTALLSTSPTCNQATTQFDRLIADVTRSLQAPAGPGLEALQVPWSTWRRCGRAAAPTRITR